MQGKVWYPEMREMAGRERGQGRGESGECDEEKEVPVRPCHPPTTTHQHSGRPIPRGPPPRQTPPLPLTLLVNTVNTRVHAFAC